MLLQRLNGLRRADGRAAQRTLGTAVVLLLACLGALAAGGFGSGALASASPPALPCAGATVEPDGQNSALIERSTLCLMNRLRRADGLRPLHANRVLASVAVGQAIDMVRGNYFGDDSISGASALSRIEASGYLLRASHVRLLTAQNIAWGTGPDATPEGIVNTWMQSAPHRRIILTGAYRDVGVGVAATVPGQPRTSWLGATYAVEFGARLR
jgi:uncharacterized protein YkwD